MSMNNLIAEDRMPDAVTDENSDSENRIVPQGKSVFDEHKGKLAIGVAATLGIMIFYNWLEKQLAKDDPESHARLQRLKAVVRAREANMQVEDSIQHAESQDNEELEEMMASQVMNCKESDGISAPR